MNTLKRSFIEIQDNRKNKIDRRSQAFIERIPMGLKFKTSRKTTFQLKEDVFENARQHGWLSS